MLDASALPTDFGQQEEYYGYVTFENTEVVTDVLRVPFYGVPQPYAELSLTDNGMDGDFFGTYSIDHTGPVSSSLWAYPLYVMDGNEVTQGDEGDIRMVGMDYYFHSATNGDIIAMAIDAYGKWHTPQPYFAEFDLYIDSDTDFIAFNFNYGWFTGGDDTDEWMVMLVVPGYGIYLASPYFIYTDYNTGLMEWYMPTSWISWDPANTDFDFAIYGFDWDGNVDVGGAWYFDAMHPPFGLAFSGDPGPDDPMATGYYWLNDALGYANSEPYGLMVVDYAGEAGVGQAYALPFNIESPFRTFLPVIMK